MDTLINSPAGVSRPMSHSFPKAVMGGRGWGLGRGGSGEEGEVGLGLQGERRQGAGWDGGSGEVTGR